MELLIILFFIFVVLPAILPRLLIFLAKRKMRSTMNKMYEQQQRQQQQRQAQSNHSNNNDQTQPRKKINKDVGEYVSFEEIADNNPAQNINSNNNTQSSAVEPQISDADWEEIK